MKIGIGMLLFLLTLYLAAHVSYIPGRFEETVLRTERLDNVSDRVFYGDRRYVPARVILHVER